MPSETTNTTRGRGRKPSGGQAEGEARETTRRKSTELETVKVSSRLMEIVRFLRDNYRTPEGRKLASDEIIDEFALPGLLEKHAEVLKAYASKHLAQA